MRLRCSPVRTLSSRQSPRSRHAQSFSGPIGRLPRWHDAAVHTGGTKREERPSGGTMLFDLNWPSTRAKRIALLDFAIGTLFGACAEPDEDATDPQQATEVRSFEQALACNPNQPTRPCPVGQVCPPGPPAKTSSAPSATCSATLTFAPITSRPASRPTRWTTGATGGRARAPSTRRSLAPRRTKATTPSAARRARHVPACATWARG